MKIITDIVTLVRSLTTDKGGTFVLGLAVPIIPCYFILASLKRESDNHSLELKKYDIREQYWKNKADSCEVRLTSSYRNGFDDGRNSVREQLDITMQMYDDIESSLSKKEQKIRKDIDRVKKEISK